MPKSDTSTSSRNVFPFKVQINFDIPIFEGQIDVDVVYKWLNLIEGYCFVHNFFSREKITFALLSFVPHVKHWWDTLCEKMEIEGSKLFAFAPTWGSFRDFIKEHYYTIWTTLQQERDQTIP
jgi:hypothetical protein